MAYTKTNLIKDVAQQTGNSEKVVRSVLNGISETVKEKLIFGMDVRIPDFVNFTLTISPEHKKRNPITKEIMIVPKKYRIKTTLPVELVNRIKQKTVY